MSKLEAEVMEVVWTLGDASVRSVMEAMNDGAPSPRAYTTFMTIMVRLEAKGVARRRRQGKTDCYSPVFSREEYRELRAESEIDAIVRDYGEVALTQFARRIAGLDPERRVALERLAGGERDEGRKG
ncbi:MAG: BlaI/MecI/CopY family transcriptional regulator [Actinomycetota bacterium]|nr:BlaI/MecI/CopY family transcriptional regulator [Actinomycetota bacterium]